MTHPSGEKVGDVGGLTDPITLIAKGPNQRQANFVGNSPPPLFEVLVNPTKPSRLVEYNGWALFAIISPLAFV